MGIVDYFSDIMSSVSFSLPEAHADAPAPEEAEEASNSTEHSQAEEKEEKKEEEDEEKPAEEEKEEEEGGEEQEEEEEEEEEEPEDIKPKLEEECANSPQCAPAKHHYDECVARVTAAQEDGDNKGPNEDCVEEFFHLTHCATQCAAPKLWAQLK